MVIKKLRALCEKWGGSLVCIDKATFHHLDLNRSRLAFSKWDLPEFSPGPTGNTGVVFERKEIVYYRPLTVVDEGTLIHEMGHVFACRQHPDAHNCNEYAFLGWEWAVAKKVGIEKAWIRSSHDYAVDGGVIFADLTEAELKAVLNERLKSAKGLGLVSKRGEPKAIR